LGTHNEVLLRYATCRYEKSEWTEGLKIPHHPFERKKEKSAEFAKIETHFMAATAFDI
jgi:hypothetical protein